MALKGSLKDFSLPDLFQLLNISKKNGTLNLVRGNARGYVCFRNGEVFFATTNWKRKPLGVKLLQAGIVTKAQVDEALELQRTTARGQRLGQLLIRLGYLTKDKLEQFVQEQIQDAVFELLRWTDGDFDFQPGVVFPEEDIGLSISTEELIMEGSRRLDEWNRIEKKVPDLNAVFKMKSMRDRSSAQISLTPEEWMVLTYMDGERTVKDIIDLAGMGTLQTCKIIYGLITAGLLENVSPDAEERKVEQELERMAEELQKMEERVIERPGFIRREDLTPIGLEEEEEEAAAAPFIEEVAPPEVEAVPEEELEEEELARVEEAFEEVAPPQEEAGVPQPPGEEERPAVEETPPAAAREEAPAAEVEIEVAPPGEEERPAVEETVPAAEVEIEPLEVEIGEDAEGEILIEEIPAEEVSIAEEAAVEVEEVVEEVAEEMLAAPEAPAVEEEEAPAAEEAAVEVEEVVEEVAEEMPAAPEAPAVEEEEAPLELEELVARAAEEVLEETKEEARPSRPGAALEFIAELPEEGEGGEEELSPQERAERLEAEMLAEVLEEAEGAAPAPGAAPRQAVETPPAPEGEAAAAEGETLGVELEELPAGEAAAPATEAGEEIVELKSKSLEETEEAVREISLEDKEGELRSLKEKIMSLLPEGVDLSEAEEKEAAAAVEEEEAPPTPSYRHESMTKESIEAQAAKRAYLEKRYGKVGKLADHEQIAELEPEEIPLEWSGHLARISHAREEPTIPSTLIERDREAGPAAEAEAAPAGKGIDPTRILGAAFRRGDLREEERAFLGIDEHVVELPPRMEEAAAQEAVFTAEPETAAAPGESAVLDRISGLLEAEETPEEVLPEAAAPAVEEPQRGLVLTPLEMVGLEPPAVEEEEGLDPVAALEADMLEDLAPGEEPAAAAAPGAVEEEVLPAEEAAAPAAVQPAVDDTFLRIEELELDMLEGVVEEERVALEAAPPAEAASRLEDTVPVEMEAVPVEAYAASAGRAPYEPVGVEELERDMLVDFIPEAEDVAAGPGAVEAAGGDSLELEAAELEEQVFGEGEAALEEDILTDIEEIERQLAGTVEEEALPLAPEYIEAPEAPPAPPQPAPPLEEAASELDVLEKIIEAPEAPPAPPQPAPPAPAEASPPPAPAAEAPAPAPAAAATTPEAWEGTAAPQVEEKLEGPAPAAAAPAEVSAQAGGAAPGDELFDMGSYTLERELAELTGAGAPAATKKIKIPVKQAKEGEKAMQQEGKPVPKVKRDKTVTKGIVMRIIDGIKKL